MPKIVNTALKAKAKAIKFGLEAPRGQGLASRTTSLHSTVNSPKVNCILSHYYAPAPWDSLLLLILLFITPVLLLSLQPSA